MFNFSMPFFLGILWRLHCRESPFILHEHHRMLPGQKLGQPSPGSHSTGFDSIAVILEEVPHDPLPELLRYGPQASR